jgi:PAS domain S-box-containing protein
MQHTLKILLLEDNRSDAELIQRLLVREKMNCRFVLAMDKTGFLEALENFIPDVILSDHSLPQFNSAAALETARRKFPFIPFIMVTGTASEEFAADIIKKGADDYILKDRMARLPAAINAALQQRKAQKEIADYKYALDESSIVAITDQKGIIKYANSNFCKISQFSNQELVGRDHRIINSGYHPPEYIKTLWTTIARGKIWRGEFCNRAKNGSIYWVDTTIIPFVNEKNKPYQYLAIRIDITEKKNAEEALRQSEMRLNEAQALAHIGNWEIDFTSNRHLWSQELFRIYGFSNNEVEPTIDFFISLIHPEDQQEAQLVINDALQHFTKGNASFRFLRKDGIIRHGYIEWRFVFDTKGKARRLFGILQDITERKETEEDLKTLEYKIQEQKIQEQKKIARAIIKAQEKERNHLGQELHDDINQKLAAVNMYLFAAGKKNEAFRQLLEYPVKLIESTVEDIRLLCQRMTIPARDIDLKELLMELLQYIKQNSETQTAFIYAVPAALLSDDLKLNLYRIIQEQMNNILKYAAARQVKLHLTIQNHSIVVHTEDDGEGFITTKKRKGIGLTNMMNRVESFNGTMEIISAPGKGCKIAITIPV